MSKFQPFFILLTLLFITPSSFSQTLNHKFLECLVQQDSNTTQPDQFIFTQHHPNYTPILQSSTINLRYLSSKTPKPLAIITPSTHSQIQSTILCSQRFNLRIRIRSGGHDYAGLSYTSHHQNTQEHPNFILLDLKHLRSVSVSINDNSTAWVESGATLGELYYWVSKTSKNLGFPAGVCPGVGIGGHVTGGGFGNMVRKYGLAADNVVDAKIIDVNARVLDRNSMGEDLFWAIRGGGGGSFGVVVAWKVNLVLVPDKVTVFTVFKTLEQGGSNLFNTWQHLGHKLSQDLFIRVIAQPVNKPFNQPVTNNGSNSKRSKRSRTVRIVFNSMFLGTVDELMELMTEGFPELGLQESDCKEMSWIESVMYFSNQEGESREVLKDRKQEKRSWFNAKSDYVTEVIPEGELGKMEGERAMMIMEPHGGKMDEIGESVVPYPYRKGCLYNIQYYEKWEGDDEEEERVRWMRRMYERMRGYVMKNPRGGYVNYRDLDLGKNGGVGDWGRGYFGKNFERLVMVKGRVDPGDFFHFEQSIPLPPLVVSGRESGISSSSYQRSTATTSRVCYWDLVSWTLLLYGVACGFFGFMVALAHLPCRVWR